MLRHALCCVVLIFLRSAMYIVCCGFFVRLCSVCVSCSVPVYMCVVMYSLCRVFVCVFCVCSVLLILSASSCFVLRYAIIRFVLCCVYCLLCVFICAFVVYIALPF